MPFPKSICSRQIDGLNLFSRLAKNRDPLLAELPKRFQNQVRDIAFGYALGGHHDAYKTFIERDPALLFDVAKGLARSDEISSIQQLYKNYPDAEDQITQGLISGYAQAGNEALVNPFVNKYPRYLSSAIEGYAATNQASLLKEALSGTKLYAHAIESAAFNGQVELVDELLKLCDITRERDVRFKLTNFPVRDQKNEAKQTLVNKTYTAYLAGAHFKAAGEMIQRGAVASLAYGVMDRVGLNEAEMTGILVKYTPRDKQDDLIQTLEAFHASILGEASLEEVEEPFLEKVNKAHIEFLMPSDEELPENNGRIGP